jgi:DNA-binding NarL/FixJ family response regulator
MFNLVAIHSDLTLIQLLKHIILHEPEWHLLLTEANYQTFKDHFPKRAHIDVAILDSTEIKHIKDLKTLSSQAKVIVLSDVEDENDALKAFHNGAVGYLNSAEFKSQIPHFIKIVIAGGVLISPIIARHLIGSLSTPFSESSKNNYHLTPKEIEVIHLISMGYSYDKMAGVLNITKNGVRFHVRNIYVKLRVNNRVDAARKWNNSTTPLDPQQEG